MLILSIAVPVRGRWNGQGRAEIGLQSTGHWQEIFSEQHTTMEVGMRSIPDAGHVTGQKIRSFRLYKLIIKNEKFVSRLNTSAVHNK